nr:radical SAM protein [Fusobacterium gastrosuis]
MLEIETIINGDLAILKNIEKVSEENYWKIIEKEKELSEEKGIKNLNLYIGIKDIKSLYFLLENDYYLKVRENDFYILEKECFKDKSWRISLTEECNYRCFFCHEEGLDMTRKRKEIKKREEIYELIKLGLKNNYTDITFTGGEPLLKRKDIIWHLEELEKENLKPDITIVTNGLHINDELLDAVDKYSGKIKFNFSMHSLSEDKYLLITKPKSNAKKAFSIVIENIKKIKKRNIDIKLNFVLLKDLNTSKEEIRKILDFAFENEIECVKFLELLVINTNNYKNYYELSSLYDEWKNEFEDYKKAPRRTIYLYKKNVKVELQQCTCAIGCAKCLLNRDVNLTAELKYFPCFLISKNNYQVNPENLLEKIEKGNKEIKLYGEKYGNSSPLLIKQKNFVDEKKEYYYVSEKALSLFEIYEILKKNGYTEYERRNFEEIYFKPSNNVDKRWKDFNMIYKIYKNNHSTFFIEIIQNIELIKEKNKDNEVNIKFFNRIFNSEPKKIHIDELNAYKNYMLNINFEAFLELDWETTSFRKGNSIISIAYIKKYNKITFMSSTKIQDNFLYKELKLKTLDKNVQTYIIS